MSERDLVMKVVAQRLLAMDRIWDLVTNSEAADQNTIAVADIRAALTARQWIPPCGDPDCDGRCAVCDAQAREDALIERVDARRKGDPDA